ncbi:hypothetical protein AVEN_43945-1 [Araneus ventricosus]|uniref:Uncharacterized protein n=1 Tax=Araneus ventricosus TaxID=182803 RepID=A0A4Y2LW27_ARAVE|nr:hypothetical protein AVEN_43945-1 [Araneus ventricosus]
MKRTTPELAPSSPNFRTTPAGGSLDTAFDLACNRPHTRRILSGIGFRACDPPVPSGCGGRVVRCQPRSRKVRGLKPDSTEDPSCIGPVARQIIRRESKRILVGVVQKFGEYGASSSSDRVSK